MSDFDKETLNNLENLCKIKLTEKEKKEFLEKLQNILNFVEQLKELNTENVHPCKYVLKDKQTNIFKEDTIHSLLKREDFLSNSPEQIAGMIKVPTIISQE